MEASAPLVEAQSAPEELRGVHLQSLGRGNREAFRDSVQPQTVGGAADRDGNLVAGRPRAAARSRRDDRGRAPAGPEAHGSERALRLSAARRIPEAHGRLGPASEGRCAAGRARGEGLAAQAHDHAQRRRRATLRPPHQHHAAAGADPAARRRSARRRSARPPRACGMFPCAASTSASAARISRRSTGSTIPKTRCSIASSCRAMPARTAIRRAVSASPARSLTRRTSRCRAMATN